MDAHKRKQSLQHYYSPDRTTLVERVGSSSTPKREDSRLKRQVLRIMDRLLNLGDADTERDETPDPATIRLREDAAPESEAGAKMSTSKSITYEYIQMRFTRSIAQARANQNEDEVLRLERLLTLMENGEVHPVQAARHAWLNPAFRNHLLDKK